MIYFPRPEQKDKIGGGLKCDLFIFEKQNNKTWEVKIKIIQKNLTQNKIKKCYAKKIEKSL